MVLGRDGEDRDRRELGIKGAALQLVGEEKTGVRILEVVGAPDTGENFATMCITLVITIYGFVTN